MYLSASAVAGGVQQSVVGAPGQARLVGLAPPAAGADRRMVERRGAQRHPIALRQHELQHLRTTEPHIDVNTKKDRG